MLSDIVQIPAELRDLVLQYHQKVLPDSLSDVVRKLIQHEQLQESDDTAYNDVQVCLHFYTIFQLTRRHILSLLIAFPYLLRVVLLFKSNLKETIQKPNQCLK